MRGSLSPKGREILSQLLTQNSELAKGITAEDLCRALPIEAGAVANHSVIYHLSLAPEGRIILSNLFNQNPSLAAGISAEALQLECTIPDTENAKSSTLLELQKSDEGKEILKKISDNKPSLNNLIEELPTKHLVDLGLFANKETNAVNYTDSNSLQK